MPVVKRLPRKPSPQNSPAIDRKEATLVDSILNRLRNHPIVAIVVVVASVITGITSFTKDVRELLHPFVGERPSLEQVARDLGAASIEGRIVAARKIGSMTPSDENEGESIVRILEAFLNRRAETTSQPVGDTREDIAAALVSLGSILKISDNRSYKVRKPNLGRINLATLHLPGIYLRGVTFENTSFDGAELEGADFSMALLVDVQFRQVRAQKARFSSATIRGGCFEESILDGAVLEGLMAWSSDFNGATMKDSQLTGATFNNTRLAGVDFEGADMTNADLRSGLELIDRQVNVAKTRDGVKLPKPIYIKSRLTVCSRQ